MTPKAKNTEAYGVLSNSVMREEYDRTLKKGKSQNCTCKCHMATSTATYKKRMPSILQLNLE
jgi:DnaJ-class molecular chaperone